MRSRIGQKFERLEDRRLMTVIAEAVGGDLLLSGTPDGAVEVVAAAPTSFDVYDDGQLIASLDGVDDDIRINIDGESAGVDDDVILQLQGTTVDQVIVDLGEGNNSMMLVGGDTSGSVVYRGGDGDDAVAIGEDVNIGRSLNVYLQDGHNDLDVAGTVGRSMRAYAGAGDDSIRLADTASVARRATIRAGDGDNTALVEGSIGRAFHYRGGVDDDLVDVLAGSVVEGRSTIWLGGGDNDLAVEGALGSHLNGYAQDGDDAMSIGDTGEIDGNARLRFGGGENSLANDGLVTGSVIVDAPPPAPVSSAVTAPAVNLPTFHIASFISVTDMLNGSFEFHGVAQLI